MLLFTVLSVVPTACQDCVVPYTPPSMPHEGYAGTHVPHGPETLDAQDRHLWQRPEQIVQAMDILPGMVVADVGAGTGYFLPHLSRAVGESGQVIGVDLDPERVVAMRERIPKENLLNVSVRLATPTEPGLDTASVDRILMVDTWHHIGPERVTYGAALRNSLRPGGAIFVVDRMDATMVMAELTRVGFEATIVPLSLPRQSVVRGNSLGF
jgi:cyclopropane fatty-acyl-phospholipid synthase-like methyltransferase